MTSPTDPHRPAAPSAREIADLTARLRALSTPGRERDPVERAVFLADKDALIERILTATDDQPTPAWPDRRTTLERLAEPARPDDPAEIAARVAALRKRVRAPETADSVAAPDREGDGSTAALVGQAHRAVAGLPPTVLDPDGIARRGAATYPDGDQAARDQIAERVADEVIAGESEFADDTSSAGWDR